MATSSKTDKHSFASNLKRPPPTESWVLTERGTTVLSPEQFRELFTKPKAFGLQVLVNGHHRRGGNTRALLGTNWQDGHLSDSQINFLTKLLANHPEPQGLRKLFLSELSERSGQVRLDQMKRILGDSGRCIERGRDPGVTGGKVWLTENATGFALATGVAPSPLKRREVSDLFPALCERAVAAPTAPVAARPGNELTLSVGRHMWKTRDSDPIFTGFDVVISNASASLVVIDSVELIGQRRLGEGIGASEMECDPLLAKRGRRLLPRPPFPIPPGQAVAGSACFDLGEFQSDTVRLRCTSATGSTTEVTIRLDLAKNS